MWLVVSKVSGVCVLQEEVTFMPAAAAKVFLSSCRFPRPSGSSCGRGSAVLGAQCSVCSGYAVPKAGALTSTLLLAVRRVSSKLGLCSSTLHWSSPPALLLGGHQAPRQSLGS